MSPAEKILFVGKNQVLADVVCDCLTKKGYNVVLTAETETALALLQKDPPALVVVDLEQSDKVLAAPRLLRDALASGDGHVLVLTQKPDAKLSRMLQKLGVSSLTKPITPDLLAATVGEELALRKRIATGEYCVLPSPSNDNLEVSAELVDLLVFDEVLPSLDTIYEKAADLEIRVAVFGVSSEIASLLDVFDGKRSLRELIAEYPKLTKKILFLATYLSSVQLLVEVAGSSVKCHSPAVSETWRENDGRDFSKYDEPNTEN